MWWTAMAYANTTTWQLTEAGTDLPVLAEVVCGEQVVQSQRDGTVTIDVSQCSFVLVRSPHHHPLRLSVEQMHRTHHVVLQPTHQQETVLIEEERTLAHPQNYGLDSEDLQRTPGGFDDPIRLIQSLPGTVSTREYGRNAGDVILRGAAPYESRLYIDGVEVPYLYHFDNYASILPTKMVDNVIVYPSNFGTSYGDAIGGIVALESKEANTDDVKVFTQANLIMAGVQATMPVSVRGEKKGVLSLSGRRSFADLYESSNEQYSLWPTFSDYAVRYDYHNSQGHHFRWTALGAMDRYGRYIYDADELDPYERSVNPNLDMQRRFDGGVFRWDWRSVNYRARTSVALMRDDWRASLDSKFGETESQRRLDRYSWIRHESILVQDRVEWSIGFDQRLGMVSQDVVAFQPNPTVQSDAPLLAQGTNLDRRLWEWRQGAWVEPRFDLGDWRLVTGIRVQALPLLQTAGVDPRMQLHRKFGWGKWHLGIGRYHQSPPFEQASLTNFAVSDQVSTGVEWDVYFASGSIDLRVGADVWAKSSDNKWMFDPDGMILVVEEQATGGEVYVTSRMDQWNMRFGLSSTNGRLKFQEQWHLSPYHQPIYFNAMLGRKSERWTLGVRYRYASGLPYIVPESSVLDTNQDLYLPTWSTFPTERMPAYQKIDVQIARHWKLRQSELKAYCEAWAVPESGNYLYPIYNYNYTESQLVIGPAFVPLLGISLER